MGVYDETGFVSTDEMARREHDPDALAKRVVIAPAFFAPHATQPRTADPVTGALTAASVSLALGADKSYRVVASSPMHMRLSRGASTAVTTDIYMPAGAAFEVPVSSYDTLSAIKAAGATDGIVQIMEVT